MFKTQNTVIGNIYNCPKHFVLHLDLNLNYWGEKVCVYVYLHTFASDGLEFIFGKEPVMLSSAIHGKMLPTKCYASQVIFTCVRPTFVNYIGKETS